ncbi:BolA family protein [Halorubellus litoreus]|uniref:BolA family protein n=1 Tax=Halorubellus litoreus TaxID=755308 RepID=A0ABD5VGF2_9EURY
MDERDIAELIEAGIPEANATVTRPRGPDDDDHFAATVVSPAFEGETVVAQHEMVYDALGEHMTTDIHAIELTTRTPDQVED